MANEKNLAKGKSTQFQSREEAVRNGRKGGKKSAEARRKKKLLQQCMEVLLALDIQEADILKEFESMGLADTSNKMLIAFGLFRAAVAGDVRAFREIKSLIGEAAGDDISKLDAVLDKIEGNI